MRILLISGFNTWHIRALVSSGINSVRDGWVVKMLPSGQKPIGFTKTGNILETAAQNSRTHILGVSQQDGLVRQRLAGQLKPYFRFRWLDGGALSEMLASNFSNVCEILIPILQEEERWEAEVKPKLASDALLLPKDIFRVEGGYDIWGQSEAYNDPHTVVNSARLIKRFSAKYFLTMPPAGHYARSTNWVSGQDRVFDHRGARHGEPPFPRGWKYSLGLEEGFHYDVSSANGRAFTIDGFDGTSGQLASRDVDSGKHVNIDSHGFFR
ncbi:hypothetical protein J7432_10520 [Xanthomonas axonopodis pv. begoniae]|nr:hypothetical protein [Xanthomonas axonopodis pv. begoniae]